MTTNKPEVVIWTNEGNLRRVREMPHTGVKAKTKGQEEQGFHVGLIRLRDYEALQVECEKLRRNAERYRWLRDFSSDDLCVVRIDYWSDEYVGTAGVEVIDGHHLDSDVDAARAAGGEK